VFKQDDGGVNGRPHYSSVVPGGLSLYYSTSAGGVSLHQWVLSSDKSSVLEGGLSFASFETAGWMPVGIALNVAVILTYPCISH
jgi:hypothetical protein